MIPELHQIESAVRRCFRSDKWPSSAMDFDDLIQEVWLVLHDLCEVQCKYDSVSDKLLRSITRNVIGNFYKRECRRNLKPLPDDSALPGVDLRHLFGAIEFASGIWSREAESLFTLLTNREQALMTCWLNEANCDSSITAMRFSIEVKTVQNLVSKVKKRAAALHRKWLASALVSFFPLLDSPSGRRTDAEDGIIDLSRNKAERAKLRIALAMAANGVCFVECVNPTVDVENILRFTEDQLGHSQVTEPAEQDYLLRHAWFATAVQWQCLERARTSSVPFIKVVEERMRENDSFINAYFQSAHVANRRIRVVPDLSPEDIARLGNGGDNMLRRPDLLCAQVLPLFIAFTDSGSNMTVDTARTLANEALPTGVLPRSITEP